MLPPFFFSHYLSVDEDALPGVIAGAPLAAVAVEASPPDAALALVLTQPVAVVAVDAAPAADALPDAAVPVRALPLVAHEVVAAVVALPADAVEQARA
jgi:hypothetical protein